MAKSQASGPLRFSQLRPGRARRGVGYWAFVLNRISGVALTAYLILHLGVLSLLYQGRAAYDAFIRVAGRPAMLCLDLLLVAGAIYHGFNGLRIAFAGLGVGLRRQILWFWISLGLGISALGVMGLLMLSEG